MIKAYDFFDSEQNKNGKGLNHQYEEIDAGIIVDRTTGLTWKISGSKKVMTYNDASEYIKSYNACKPFSGYDKWRMPTLEEAMSLLEPFQSANNLFIDNCLRTNRLIIWTCDQTRNGNQLFVNFSLGCYSIQDVPMNHIYLQAVSTYDRNYLSKPLRTTPRFDLVQTRCRIFISYRREDSEDISGRIYDRLDKHFGDGSIFMDTSDLEPGEDFRKSIKASIINDCDILLAIVGKKWKASKWVRFEIETAQHQRLKIIPVTVHNATMPAEHDLPEPLKQLRSLNAFSIRSGSEFNQGMESLIEKLEDSNLS